MNTTITPHKNVNRDVTLLPVSADQHLVISCDSCGGVGNKEKDLVKVPPEITGYYTCRVATMEILAVGARPEVVIDTLAVEWDPTGKQIYHGIQRFLEESGLNISAINGSTEENFPMVQTAIGITVIGRVFKKDLRLNRSRAGDELWMLGLPKVGHEILHPYDPEVASISSIQALLQDPGITGMIPVGSKGVGYEASLLAAESQLKIEWVPDLPVSMDKSAGPSTCVVLSLDSKILPEWREKLASETFLKLGTLKGVSP